MAIEHKDIPDAQLHEPKGVASASEGDVYVADGVGSGSWTSPELEGQALAATGSVPIKQAGGGVAWSIPAAFDPAYCEVDKSESIVSLTGSTEVSVTGAFFDDYVADKFTLTGGTSLTVVETGIYVAHWSIGLKPQSAVGATNEIIEARLLINGTVSNPFRIVPITIMKNAAIDDPFMIGGNRILDLTAGDVLTMTLKNLAETRSYKTTVNFNMFRIA